MIYLFMRGIIRRYRVMIAVLRNCGRLSYGSRFIVGPGLRVGRGRRLDVGDRVSIGRNLDCMSNLRIGPDVMISSGVSFVGDDHEFGDPERTIQEQNRKPFAEAVLEGDNLVGYGTLVVGSVRIARGAIIGAGSLVASDIEESGVYVGRPAKKVKERYT